MSQPIPTGSVTVAAFCCAEFAEAGVVLHVDAAPRIVAPTPGVYWCFASLYLVSTGTFTDPGYSFDAWLNVYDQNGAFVRHADRTTLSDPVFNGTLKLGALTVIPAGGFVNVTVLHDYATINVGTGCELGDGSHLEIQYVAPPTDYAICSGGST